MTGSDFTGCMINSHVELKTWVREHMAALIQSGRLFDKKAYKECFKILKKARSVGLIIPLDEEAVMEPQVDSFMRVIQEQGHTKLINRTIFYGIQVLIGDSDDESRQEMLLLHLERIISKAAVEDDQTLTKRTCREKLKAALGLSTLDPIDIAFINQEIPRISRIASLCVEYMYADNDADS